MYDVPNSYLKDTWKIDFAGEHRSDDGWDS